MQTVTYSESQYAVAHDGNGTVVFNTLQEGQEMATGLPYVRKPESEGELEKDVDELTGVPNYYKASKYGELYLLAKVNERYSKPVFDHSDGEEIEDAPFDITTHRNYRYDHNIDAWVEEVMNEEGEWQLKSE